MLVDLVKLRHDGVKRAREEVRTAQPMRGDLSVYVYRGVRSAFLHPTEGRHDPLMLEACLLTRMRGASFVVIGHEVEHYRGEVRRHEQAWWCRLPAQGTDRVIDYGATLNREERRLARAERG